jgi:hypothetical protein
MKAPKQWGQRKQLTFTNIYKMSPDKRYPRQDDARDIRHRKM